MNALLREIQCQIIDRQTMVTVAQQKDPMKRARDARLPQNLGGKGFLILGHQGLTPTSPEDWIFLFRTRGSWFLAGSSPPRTERIAGSGWVIGGGDSPAPAKIQDRAQP